jgi:hypothetical protein
MSMPAQQECEEFPWLAMLLAVAIVAAVIWMTRG